ncbi:organoarsenical effux MFS transporter ArsJ [Alphaproteobacteria bacterium]|nr:organoarsenical effux MFS transporter ArsJ [Alphaproteobacteria bacterium]
MAETESSQKPGMSGVRNYAIVSAAYWGFTLTDGALRMLVLLHFHTLGYSPFQLASLFMLYEIMGVVTNLVGGWLASQHGLKIMLNTGLGLQVAALITLSLLDPAWSLAWSISYVLAVQGVSGVAKDLTKISSKSAIKLVVPNNSHSTLFKWVAVLTGSKNALKGVGFFLGGLLLSTMGFVLGLWLMAACLALVLLASISLLPHDMSKGKSKTKVSALFSKSQAINLLSAARVFLFGARDVWFAVGLPVFLVEVLDCSFASVGAFLALWIIGYGFVQGSAPIILKSSRDGRSSEVKAAQLWVFILTGLTMMVASAIHAGYQPAWTLIIGLGVFGFCFAINSAVHSYLILAFSKSNDVAQSVGFYYSANAAGRLAGTLLSGIAYQWQGLAGCLGVAAGMLVLACVFTVALGATKQIRPGQVATD